MTPLAIASFATRAATANAARSAQAARFAPLATMSRRALSTTAARWHRPSHPSYLATPSSGPQQINASRNDAPPQTIEPGSDKNTPGALPSAGTPENAEAAEKWPDYSKGPSALDKAAQLFFFTEIVRGESISMECGCVGLCGLELDREERRIRDCAIGKTICDREYPLAQASFMGIVQPLGSGSACDLMDCAASKLVESEPIPTQSQSSTTGSRT